MKPLYDTTDNKIIVIHILHRERHTYNLDLNKLLLRNVSKSTGNSVAIKCSFKSFFVTIFKTKQKTEKNLVLKQAMLIY